MRVDAVQIPNVIELMERWIAARSACPFVAFSGMHGITETQLDPSFKQILNSVDLVVADGMPPVWLGRWQGYATRWRVYGPELTGTFCRRAGAPYQHHFYGGGPGVADRLAEMLKQRYRVRAVGTCSPPFKGTDLRGVRQELEGGFLMRRETGAEGLDAQSNEGSFI